MRQRLSSFFNDIRILPKLLLISAIPLISLILFSVVTYTNVQTFSHDEERLNDLYLLQKTAAQYMRLVVDLETGFRGYVISKDDRDLRPYDEAREGVVAIGRDLEGRLPRDQEQQFKELQQAVTQFVAEKEELVQAIRSGSQTEAIAYIREGRGRQIMADIRKWMARFEQTERQIAQQELSRVSRDRTSARYVMLGGGFATLWLITRTSASDHVGSRRRTFFALMLLGDAQKKQVATSYSGQAIVQAIDNIPVAVPEEVHGVLQKLRNQLIADAGGVPATDENLEIGGGLFSPGGLFSTDEEPDSTIPAPAEQGTFGGLREIFPPSSPTSPPPTSGLQPIGEREANSLLREIEERLNRR